MSDPFDNLATRIEPHHSAALMGYANQIDARVQATDPNADVWHQALGGGSYELAHKIIKDYYAKHDPKLPEKAPISPGWVRQEAKAYREREQNRRIAPPEPRQGSGPPPHVKAKLDAFKAKHGIESKGIRP